MPTAPLLLAGAGLATLATVVVAGPGPGTAPRVPARPAVLPRAAPAAATPAGSPTARPVYRWPVPPPPVLLRRFAVGPYRWSPGHRGVDLAVASGAEILAAGPGVVTFAGPVAGRGVVAVGHAGGVRTTYEPLTPRVRAGDRVVAGAVIGVLAAGAHCGRPCLHWGALRGDVYLDPLTLLRLPAPPVLLPLG
jgi:murein DD-endopeptidase MepM/ murein hydrolase activator NlpD